MKKVCIVVSSTYTLELFLVAQIRALARLYNVTIVANDSDPKILDRLGLDARLITVRIERKIHPIRDVCALALLFGVFRRERFDLVHSVTPKAGFLSMIAACFAGTSVRVHTFTGQVWSTKTGTMRWILKFADKATAFFATNILVDSHSQCDFIIREGVLAAKKAAVLANGSISGVNTMRFRPNPEVRARLRASLQIPVDSFVILYMARLTRDKGALVMAEAFATYGIHNGVSHLIVVGPDEEHLRPQIRKLCRHYLDRLHFVDLVRVPEEYMACADVFCLPSFREGFGSALINAAAVGIPAIATRIYGSSDAVVDGVTGFLFSAGNIDELVGLLRRLHSDPDLRTSMGLCARARATDKFSEELLTSSLLAFYRERIITGKQ